MHVGEVIRGERRKRGMKQLELAAKAEIAGPTLCKIELGHREPTLEQLRRIAAALETTVPALWPETDAAS